MSEAVDSFIRVRFAPLAKTKCDNDHSLLHLFSRAVGNPHPHQLTRTMQEDHFITQCDQKPRSWNKIRSWLGTYFDWRIGAGLLETAWSTSGPSTFSGGAAPQRSGDQIRRLLDVQDPRRHALLAIAADTDLRASTIPRLPWAPST